MSPPPNWPSIFFQPFFSRHSSKQRPSFSSHCIDPFTYYYVVLFSLTLRLRQRIRPFSTNKAPLHRDRALLARAPTVGEGSGWSAHAVAQPKIQSLMYLCHSVTGIYCMATTMLRLLLGTFSSWSVIRGAGRRRKETKAKRRRDKDNKDEDSGVRLCRRR